MRGAELAEPAPARTEAAERPAPGLDPEGYPGIGYAWYVVGVLLVAAVTSYLDSTAISSRCW
jgi:hypothetical protein